MASILRVYTIDSPQLREFIEVKPGNIDSFRKYERLMLNIHPEICLIGAMLMPVRTNRISSFSQDFFLPTTVHLVWKVQGVANRIFPVIVSLLLDIVTFPIRCVTCIPRFVLNAFREQHPLARELEEKGFSIKGIERLRVESVFIQEDTDLINKISMGCRNGAKLYNLTRISKTVNFISMPFSLHISSCRPNPILVKELSLEYLPEDKQEEVKKLLS